MSAEAETVTVTASKITSSSASWTDSGNNTWSVSVNGGVTNLNVTNGYAQVGTSSSPATSMSFSTSGISGTITSIVVNCAAYQGKASISATVSGSAFGTQSQSVPSWSSNNGGNVTFNGSASGAIAITMTNGSGGRAMYIKSITVTYAPSTEPEIEAQDQININHDATSGSFNYTIKNPISGTSLAAASSTSWISDVTVGTNKVTFNTQTNTAAEERTGTITLTYGDITKNVTVKQGAFAIDYAGLPFNYDGNGISYLPTGFTVNGLDDIYSSSPKMKFDATNDYAILKISERPGRLTFNIKGNSFNGGTFKVQTSEDGENYSDLQIYTELGASVQSEEFRNLGADVRYIKWIYTEKVSGNVALGNINLAQYVAPQNYAVSWTAGENTELFVFAGDESETIENGASVPEWTTVMVSVDVADGYELGALTVKDADNNEIDLTSIGENYYSFEMPSSDVTITSNATLLPERPTVPVAGGQYVKVTSDDNLEDGYYLIVYEEGSLALNGGITTNLDVESNFVEVRIQDAIINATTEINNVAFFYNTTNKTLQGVGGLYIGQTSNANGLKSSSDTSYENTISIDNDGNAAIVSGGAYLRYNSANDQTRFRYFKSSSYTSQKAIQIYKYVAPAPVTASVTSAGWATFSSTRALDFTNVTGVVANTAVYANGRLTYTPIQQVPANTGVILRSVSGGEASVDVPVINDIPALEEGSNMLVAVGTAISSLATVGDNNSTNYILNNVNGVLGFYRAAGNRVDAGKAYLNVPAGASRSFIDINPGEQDGIESVNVNAAEDNIYDLQGRQVAQPQKGLYIVNGKKVVIK